MAILTEEMKSMIATQQCFVATTSAEGVPNVGPKRSTRVLDDNHLVFTEGTGKQTLQNLRSNTQVAVAVVDREKLDGYRFVGSAEIIESGELFEQAAAQSAKVGLPRPQAVVKITVDSIYGLKPGPMAGTKIG